MYKATRQQLFEPEVGLTVAGKDAYLFSPREDQWGLRCRLFGMWLPMQRDWKVSLGDCKNDSSSVMFGLGPVTGKGARQITYSIDVLSKANSKGSFDDFTRSSPFKNASLTKIADLLHGVSQRAYEWKDRDLYPEAGGGHGYLIYVERPEPETKGLSLEWSSPPGEKDTGLNYYRYNQIKSTAAIRERFTI